MGGGDAAKPNGQHNVPEMSGGCKPAWMVVLVGISNKSRQYWSYSVGIILVSTIWGGCQVEVPGASKGEEAQG